MADDASNTETEPGVQVEKAKMETQPSGDVEKAGADSATAAEKPAVEQEYPPTRKVIVIVLSLYLATFLISLDRLIIVTAIPRITDEFHSFDDIGCGYMLTTCSFQLFLGRLYTFHSPKMIFLSCIFIFEVGSALCGAAPNSPIFILGRAVAGLGAAGIFGGAIVLTIAVVPLHKRPILMALNAGLFAISSVVGPLIGGAFTTTVSWRWCFYINLPFGGVAMAILFFVLKAPPPKEKGLTFRQQVARLDVLGTCIFVPCIVCLLLALQWGGSTYPWNIGRIIALLTLFGVLLVAFVGELVWHGNGTVPPRIIKQRSVAAAVLYTTCVGATMLVMAYYLPLWFQAIKGDSAVKSGIAIIPFVFGLVIGAVVGGIFTQRLGYYVPLAIACAVIVPVATGLFTTLHPSTGHTKWIGYQVLLGLGLGMQQGSLAAQTCLAAIDVPTGVSLMFFAQQLGGVVFVSVAQNVLSSSLIRGLAAAKIPGLDPRAVVDAGATNLHGFVKPEYLGAVLRAYNHAITTVFYVGVGTSCVLIVPALAMEWKSVKKGKGRGRGGGGGGAGGVVKNSEEEQKKKTAPNSTKDEEEEIVSKPSD